MSGEDAQVISTYAYRMRTDKGVYTSRKGWKSDEIAILRSGK